MSSNLVSDWFGQEFNNLHPMLQQLHRQGGLLAGTVKVVIPRGAAGIIGKRLASKLGVPTNPGDHELVVTISHHTDGLHWDRCFNSQTTMNSTFTPIGELPNGYWLENTGLLKMFLTVDTINGGWHWRCLKMKVRGLRLPLWLFPHSTAFKTIEGDKYRFYVGFSLPFFGTILSYGGLLTPSVAENIVG